MADARGKYADLIDEQTWAFIERSAQSYPDDMHNLSLPQQREAYAEMCQTFAQDLPEGLLYEDEQLNQNDHTVPLRHYRMADRKAKAHLIYYHGGGFILGNLDSHHDICADLCAQTGFDVTAVEYRLAPEHPHPAPFNDAMAAAIYVGKSTDLPIVLSGDSAGGTLSATVIGALRGNTAKATEQVAGQVLVYPSLGLNTNSGSFVEHAYAPMLTIDDMQAYYLAYSGGSHEPNDATFLPLLDKDFSDIPPTVVISAQCDPLCDDGRLYCEQINSAGGQAVWFNETGLPHAYLRARHSVQRAEASFTRIVQAIQHLGAQQWPY